MNLSFYKRLAAEFIVLGSCLCLGASLPAKIPQSAQDTQQPAPDNSKTNRNGGATADEAKMSPADRELTKRIRAALHDDPSLSVYAHNIKIITQEGKVTLRGPVRSEDEKNAIEAKVTAIAGDGNITSHLKVAPPKS